MLGIKAPCLYMNNRSSGFVTNTLDIIYCKSATTLDRSGQKRLNIDMDLAPLAVHGQRSVVDEDLIVLLFNHSELKLSSVFVMIEPAARSGAISSWRQKFIHARLMACKFLQNIHQLAAKMMVCFI